MDFFDSFCSLLVNDFWADEIFFSWFFNETSEFLSEPFTLVRTFVKLLMTNISAFFPTESLQQPCRSNKLRSVALSPSFLICESRDLIVLLTTVIIPEIESLLGSKVKLSLAESPLTLCKRLRTIVFAFLIHKESSPDAALPISSLTSVSRDRISLLIFVIILEIESGVFL